MSHPNELPMAKAGPNQIVNAGYVVSMDGSNTKDQNGVIRSYSWIQTGITSILHIVPITLKAPPSPPSSIITVPTNQTNMSSSNVSALINKGRALYNLGNYTQAITYFDKALAIEPNATDALFKDIIIVQLEL
jgi:tetratricopeptide (TPR) repeat protein